LLSRRIFFDATVVVKRRVDLQVTVDCQIGNAPARDLRGAANLVHTGMRGAAVGRE